QSTLAKKSLLRAYDTKEFKTPVAMYTLGRAKNKKKSELRLTVRLRDSVRPKIVNEENMLSMEFLNPTPKVAKRDVTSEPLPLPEFSNGDSNQVYTGAPLRKLELKGIDVREALRLITRFSGYNLILGEDVKGEIGSLSLENVPWDQALNLVLQTKKLGYVRHGNILRVATLQALTEEKEDKLKQEAAALLVEPLKTVFIPISFAKASDLQARAERFVSSRGTVDIDARTNMLIIRDTQAVINRLQKIFTVLDTPPTAVSISAKFVEAKKEFSRALGLGAFNLTGRTSGIDFGQSGGDTTTVEATALPGFGASSAGANINISAPDFAALTAQISLAEAEQKVKVLANPTIIVQQGETGTIRQNLETQVVQASAGSATVTSGLTQNAELKLEVAPIVTNDGSLLLTTQLQQDIPLAGASGQLKKDSRTVNTKIILDNGDTAVLGGIYSFQETNSDEGVPFLKNLPLLGYLFSAKGKNITQNEILVFVTGRILNGEQAFKQNM
ncbi:MAG: type IV pilus secretin PilQ, partial [Proteobacteria bacterium]|nr:type IV pilus secretin PilQ [Pseudomonadota bacterium]